MGDRFACHTVAGSDVERWSVHPDLRRADGAAGPAAEGPERAEGADGAATDWVETVAALDECDGYVVLMVDPQTAEVDAHGPFGGPDAAVAAETLRASLDAEGLDDVAVRIVRLHLPTDRAAG